MSKIELPKIICGRQIHATSETPLEVLEYETGATVTIPAVTPEDIAELEQSQRYILHDVPIQEIIAFYREVGRLWAKRDEPLRLQAIEDISHVTGFDKRMVERELNLTAVMFSFQAWLYDLLDAELGNRYYLEEFLPVADTLLHAQPRGKLLHIMVGNVPVTGVMTLLRSGLAKNATIAKVSQRDPVTPTYLAASYQKVDANHPVARSTSILYWRGGSEIEDRMIGLSNAVCVWGGLKAINSIKGKIPAGVECIEFGPKRSMCLIGSDVVDVKKVATDLAHDISIYNQEACFSPQHVYVEGDIEKFAEALAEALELYTKLLPKGHVSDDIRAHVSRSRLEAHYRGCKVYESPGTQWTIIIINDHEDIIEHPLSRTIYLKKVDSLLDCAEFIDDNVQTVTISPWSRNRELRDALTLKGACRLTEVGLVNSFRTGVSHDGVLPLSRMVRWVSVERGCDHWGKYVEQGPLDTTKYLMMEPYWD